VALNSIIYVNVVDLSGRQDVEEVGSLVVKLRPVLVEEDLVA